MGILSDSEIAGLMRANPPLLENLVDEKIQVQPAGVDLTLAKILRFKGAGAIDFSNRERVIPECKEVAFKNGWANLRKGAYKVIYNEIVRIPKDCIALAFPRSSLLRCGAFLHCAVWDPGYEGRSESLLVVSNERGIKLKKNARLVQLIFIKLSEKSSRVYRGKYFAENIV
ncbi:MAG: deoxyuridine 5'-triphosphate nucleotidohydrolase [Candidatus Micrarchaeota archaeon]|nr:deoxyuridine 5'-triphosphate nucleotidohydrolase [Candidatus Micrarchaeota archaeon]